MKCLETRTIDNGIKRRRYLRDDGTRITTYEIGSDMVFLSDLRALMRKAAAGRANQRRPAHLIARDPDKVDAVLAALERGETHRAIAARLEVSTKTIQRVKWGTR